MKIKRVSIKFEPRDIWIGVYWNKPYKNINILWIYICIVPMFPIKLEVSY